MKSSGDFLKEFTVSQPAHCYLAERHKNQKGKEQHHHDSFRVAKIIGVPPVGHMVKSFVRGTRRQFSWAFGISAVLWKHFPRDVVNQI